MKSANATVPDAPVETTLDVLRHIRELLHLAIAPRKPRQVVDLHESNASATNLTLRQAIGTTMLGQALLWSVSAAATISIGDRQIVIPAAGQGSMQLFGMPIQPYDTVKVTLNGGAPTPGALFLELIGQTVAPSEGLEVIR